MIEVRAKDYFSDHKLTVVCSQIVLATTLPIQLNLVKMRVNKLSYCFKVRHMSGCEGHS